MADEDKNNEAVLKFSVDAEALGQVLMALTGPGHLIRELQAIRNLPDNPISTLISQFNEQTRLHNAINTSG